METCLGSGRVGLTWAMITLKKHKWDKCFARIALFCINQSKHQSLVQRRRQKRIEANDRHFNGWGPHALAVAWASGLCPRATCQPMHGSWKGRSTQMQQRRKMNGLGGTSCVSCLKPKGCLTKINSKTRNCLIYRLGRSVVGQHAATQTITSKRWHLCVWYFDVDGNNIGDLH